MESNSDSDDDVYPGDLCSEDGHSIFDPDGLKGGVCPFVPTTEERVMKMIEFAERTSKDVLYDLGCGDGIIVFTTTLQTQCQAIGIDIDPSLILIAKEKQKKNRKRK